MAWKSIWSRQSRVLKWRPYSFGVRTHKTIYVCRNYKYSVPLYVHNPRGQNAFFFVACIYNHMHCFFHSPESSHMACLKEFHCWHKGGMIMSLCVVWWGHWVRTQTICSVRACECPFTYNIYFAIIITVTSMKWNDCHHVPFNVAYLLPFWGLFITDIWKHYNGLLRAVSSLQKSIR